MIRPDVCGLAFLYISLFFAMSSALEYFLLYYAAYKQSLAKAEAYNFLQHLRKGIDS